MRQFSDYQGPVVEHCDYLIVGSGPGGATLARTLIAEGKRVLLVEAGPWLRASDFIPDGGKTISSYMWDGGMRLTRGNVIMPTLQPRCLGGGSVFNAAISMRASRSALESWQDVSGLEGLSYEDLSPYYAEVEAFMGVKPTPSQVWGDRNRLFHEACGELGYTPTPLPRNVTDCRGSGECITGCRSGAKRSLDRRGIPEFVEAGGEVFCSVHVEKIVIRDGRVEGVEGFVVEPKGGKRSHPVRISARCTVLAAGALATPQIVQRGGLSRSPVGANLRMHPSGFVIGFFKDTLNPNFGATQGMHCLDFMEQGIKLESLWAPPSVFVRRFPAGGKSFKRYLKKFPKMVVWDTWVSGDASVGRVKALPGGRSDFAYDIAPADLRRLQEAHALLAEMFFAVGAKEVLPGLGGLPEIMRSKEEALRTIRGAHLQATDFQTASNHVFGTMAMGDDPSRFATDSWGQVYGVDDLYVADTSLFPLSPGANPMLTAMALARRLGEELPNRYR